jgi:YYY domain-containing protein
VNEVLRWIVAAELIAFAFLPLTVWTFRSLPDRGFAFGKIVALILVTWISWMIGFATGGGGSLQMILPVLAIGAIGVWALLGMRMRESLAGLRAILIAEEVLFLLAFIAWAVVRSLNPAIDLTEKPMDMMLLQATSHISVSPPQDLWLAGHGVNYYYFGYLLMATMGKLTGVAVPITYNLAIALIFALAIAGTYSIVYNLTRRHVWALLGPTVVVLSGNAYVVFQQLLQGSFPWNQFYWFFASSRVVGANGATINEFPMFSFVLGDLHPHVMAIPTVLACISASLAILFSEPSEKSNSRVVISPLRIAVFAILTGSLVATNTWDYPTYLFLIVIAIAVRSRLSFGNRWWRPFVTTSGLLILVSLVAFLPFIWQYTSPTSGIGPVTTVTSLAQFAEVFGVFIVGTACLAALIAYETGALRELSVWFQRKPQDGEWHRPRPDVVAVVTASVLAALTLAAMQRWVLMLVLIAFACVAWLLMHPSRDTGAEARLPDRFVMVLAAAGLLLLATTELTYLRDSFAGGFLYRMNTVFKLYYQAWILLGLATAYAYWRVHEGLQRLQWMRQRTSLRVIWRTGMTVSILMGGTYTVLGPLSYYGFSQGGETPLLISHGLNGMSWLKSADRDDFNAITWLQTHVSGTPTILEASAGPYSLDARRPPFARVSTFTGLPTLLGWADHEYQWRGSDPEISARANAINQIYSTGDVSIARQLLLKYKIALVYVGPCERQIYEHGPDVCDQSGTNVPIASGKHALTKFASFMHTVYRSDGVTIFEMRSADVITSS